MNALGILFIVSNDYYQNFFELKYLNFNVFLVRLWSTYRVRFFLHRRRRRHRKHRPIGMYDSSNESSQRTE